MMSLYKLRREKLHNIVQYTTQDGSVFLAIEHITVNCFFPSIVTYVLLLFICYFYFFIHFPKMNPLKWEIFQKKINFEFKPNHFFRNQVCSEKTKLLKFGLKSQVCNTVQSSSFIKISMNDSFQACFR